MKKILKATALSLSAALLLTACAAPGLGPAPNPGEPTAVLADTDGRLTAQGSDTHEPDSQLALSIGRFGLDLYRSLYTPDENLIISPLSLYTALAMLYSGADGQSAQQLADAMYIPEGDFHAAMRELQLYLLAPRDDTKLLTANSVWLRDSFAGDVSQNFLDNNAANYAARIEALDFDNPAAKDTINGWVEKNTNGLIQKVIENDIDPAIMLYLINTVYFKAKWTTPFKGGATHKGNFNTPAGVVQADMMNLRAQLVSYEDDNLQAAVLPYTDGKTSMLVVLPKNLDDFVKSFTAEELLPLMAKMQSREVLLTMPKVDTSTKLAPVEALAALGVTDIFDPATADLTALSPKAKAIGLHVGEISHQTVLKIDEEGTEAAAVTVVAPEATSAPIDQMVMTVDHPYFVAVVDHQAGVLFAGSIVDPTK